MTIIACTLLCSVLNLQRLLQAVFSACAKMCVRELRKTDTANVSVFYLSFCSTIGATAGLGISMTWGSGQGLMLPHAWEWALFAGIGKGFCESTPTRKQLWSLLSCCFMWFTASLFTRVMSYHSILCWELLYRLVISASHQLSVRGLLDCTNELLCTICHVTEPSKMYLVSGQN